MKPMEQKTVLIVDDDQIIREQIEKELRREFFNAFKAHDGKTALEIFRREKIDIVILDVKLPDMDGLDILATIKKEKPDCEVIVITGWGSQEIAITALRKGAIDYIEKPMKMEEVTAALGRAQEKLAEKEELSYKYRILVVDDEEEIVKRLLKVLIKEGYEAVGAGSGEEGLKVVENEKIDVIISDIQMDDMDGIEVLQRAKKLYCDIEGIVVTGHKDQELAIRSLRAGALDYITKPVNLEELLLSVQKAIEIINLNRDRLYRNRELKLSSEIISKMNEELERRIEERSKELTQTQSQLFQTSKLATLGEMSAGIAHEMNQPLGGIYLVAKYLRKLMERGKLTDKEVDLGLKDIEMSVTRMTKIIQHIRTFARQDTLQFVEVDVNATIDNAMSLLGEQLRLHGIQTELDLSPDLPKIIGEPFQLEQVWINLISNARDAADEKEKQISEGKLQMANYQKHLNISTHYHPESETPAVDIRFNDNGIGLVTEHEVKIFEPFFTTKEVGKAMGLGLSISHGIIESHKGAITLKGNAEAGTTARVILTTGE